MERRIAAKLSFFFVLLFFPFQIIKNTFYIALKPFELGAFDRRTLENLAIGFDVEVFPIGWSHIHECFVWHQTFLAGWRSESVPRTCLDAPVASVNATLHGLGSLFGDIFSVFDSQIRQTFSRIEHSIFLQCLCRTSV